MKAEICQDDQLSINELKHYARHLSLPNIGVAGQKKIKRSRVLCIGAGGLGAPLTLYLAAAGVGTIGIIDGDKVELSNLQRQILFQTDDQGQPKAEVAKRRLSALNPNIKVETYHHYLDENNVLDLFAKYDLIIDGSDNYLTRYLVNDAAFHTQKPLIYASVFQFEGQLTLFDATKNSPCYRCLYPAAPPANLVPNCAEGGVFGVLPGVMGVLQATEVIKYITGIGKPLMGRLLSYNALDMSFKEFIFQKNESCELCVHKRSFNQLSRPSQTCAVKTDINPISQISAEDLFQRQKKGEKITVLDVRQPYEYEIFNIGGMLIPLQELQNRIHELPKDNLIVVHCRTGIRSAKAVSLLKENGYVNVKNLTGGIIALAETEEY